MKCMAAIFAPQVTDFGDLEKYKTALLPPFQELDVVGVVVLVSTCSAVLVYQRYSVCMWNEYRCG